MATAHPIKLSVDELMAKARDVAGVDIVDDAAVEPLTVIHRSLSEEAKLHEQGAIAQTNKLLRLLANRLRMQRDFQRHPEIAEQPIHGPLFVMGVARSGTTKLQKALAASDDFNWLPFWKAFNWASFSGKPDESTQTRIAEAESFCRWFDAISPETRLGHPFDTFEAEEETVLCEAHFVSVSFMGYVEIPSFVQWLMKQPLSSVFGFLRDAMKYLQWQGLASPNKPWLLKAPIYNGMELEILKTFPNAKFVMAHRSPLATMPSMCKLIQCFHKAYTDITPDLTPIVEGNFMAMEHHLANRRANPTLPLLDATFERITKSFEATIEDVYSHLGMTLSDASRQRMLQWDAQHAMHKHGAFNYSLQEFGLSEKMIREKMANYFELLQTLANKRA